MTDTRDSKPYCVKAMPDGKLWMCQNLAYDITEQASSNNATGTEFDNTTGILPAGWKLPKGNTTGDFYALALAMKTASETNPVYATSDPASYGGQANWYPGSTFMGVYSGFYFSSLNGQDDLDSSGRYWSSTAREGVSAYFLGFYSGGVGPANYHDKYGGFALRGTL